MAHRLLHILTLIIVFISAGLLSCVKNDPESIPSYITIDSCSVETTYLLQGTSDNKISDAWLYVNEELIGAFETPVTIPVLNEGIANIRIKPGIKANGISDARELYPFLEPYEITTRITRDSTVKINPVYIYKEGTTFAWKEDFDDVRVSMKKTARSDTTVVITTNPEEVFEGGYSGKITLTEDKGFFEILTDTAYVLPQTGSRVFLEMNYKCETVLTVGVFVNGYSTMEQVSVLNLNPSAGWNKIYVNLTTAVTSDQNALDYSVFIGGIITEGVDMEENYIDNLKLIY